ncbi:DoxX family protein [Viridibacillus sp. NPDC093762]|uniref:DoxX family protein n=1 Tax=Viridibacillus sp. NPDC093762 TaxID=3390720 RepID=UPI003D004621
MLQGLLIFMFLIAGFGKVIGSKMHREAFNHCKLPQWCRVITGVVELIGVVFLIVGFWQYNFLIAGALLLGVVGIGGTITHIRVKDGFKDTFLIVLLGIIAFLLLFIKL